MFECECGRYSCTCVSDSAIRGKAILDYGGGKIHADDRAEVAPNMHGQEPPREQLHDA